MKNELKVKKAKRAKQKALDINFIADLIDNFVVIIFIVAIVAIIMSAKSLKKDENKPMEHESPITKVSEQSDDYHATVESSEVTIPHEEEIKPVVIDMVETVNNQYPLIEYKKTWNDDDMYLLAKIAMAEAEGEPLRTKVLVILTVLNRVNSDEFPDTIHDVLFEKLKGRYQFTPMGDGRWDMVEPNDECWNALKIVQEATHDYSNGACYFESDDEENWHSRNLTLVCESGRMQFYK